MKFRANLQILQNIASQSKTFTWKIDKENFPILGIYREMKGFQSARGETPLRRNSSPNFPSSWSDFRSSNAFCQSRVRPEKFRRAVQLSRYRRSTLPEIYLCCFFYWLFWSDNLFIDEFWLVAFYFSPSLFYSFRCNYNNN